MLENKPLQHGDYKCNEKPSCKKCDIRYCCRGKYKGSDLSLFEILEKCIEEEKESPYKDLAVYKKLRNRIKQIVKKR